LQPERPQSSRALMGESTGLIRRDHLNQF